MPAQPLMPRESAEAVVLCAPDGSAAGHMLKKDVHHTDTPLHLAFSCYVFDRGGRLLVTRRALTKKTWPGVVTNSCCGHPGPGESMREAVFRRLREELGVTVERLDLILPRFRYRAIMPDGVVENELCPVFRACVDAVPALSIDVDEVESAEWRPWASYRDAALSDPGSVSPWSALQVAELVAVGAEPSDWPVRDVTELPAAAIA